MSLATSPDVTSSPHTSRRVAITTLGCKVNQYDTATLQERLSAAGHQCVPFSDAAEVYIVNSCTVTNQADAESRQLVRRAKRRNPDARVIMTGCYAQVSPEAVAHMPEVDYVVGLNRLDDLVRLVAQGASTAQPPDQRIFVSKLRMAKHEAPPAINTFGAVTFQGQTRAFLKIQEGCDLFCTFCIVPMSRGKSRSIAPRVILDQFDRLADQGFQEVVLTGIHLGGYGADLSPQVNLTWLLEALEERRPVPRVRLSSLDPHEILVHSESLCPHLHIPLQWGEDSILARMRRRYDTALARDILTELRERLPYAALGTDLIVGFPGEGEAEFAQGMRFLEESPFTYFHVFPYSVRSGTTAAKFTDRVPPSIIQERARRVRALGERKKAAFTRQFESETLSVLFEHQRDRASGRLKGYSRNYLRVHADGSDDYMNREVPVRMTRADDGLLSGTILQDAA